MGYADILGYVARLISLLQGMLIYPDMLASISERILVDCNDIRDMLVCF